MEAFGETELCFPQLLNSSCVKPQPSDFEATLTYSLVFSVSLLTAFLNLLVIISISHFKQLHTSTNLLLLSLAVSDFFVAPLLPFQIMLLNGCWLLGDLVCTLYHFVVYIITFASVGTMVLLSVDCYVAICDPLHYSTKITRSRVMLCVCLCWICSVIFQSLILQDNLQQPGRFNSCVGECVIVINAIAGLADVIFSFILPITVIVVLYLRVFVVAVSQARAIRSHIAAVSHHSMNATALKSEVKAARTLGVVVVAFLMCFCPYYCVTLTGKDNLNASSVAFIIILSYFNACLNPVIYALFYPWLRKAAKLIVTLKILQPGSCEANVF